MTRRQNKSVDLFLVILTDHMYDSKATNVHSFTRESHVVGHKYNIHVAQKHTYGITYLYFEQKKKFPGVHLHF